MHSFLRSFAVLFCVSFSCVLRAGEITPFSIAAVADPQYADTDSRGGGREPWEGVNRLTHAIKHWNQRELDWGVNLGDVIDWDDIDYSKFPKQTVFQPPQDWKDTRAILAAWNKLNVPKYTVLGNHDFYVPYQDVDGMKKPASVYRAFGFEDKAYYEFRHKGFRFVVLEGDNSYLNYDPSLPEYKKALDYYEAFSGPQKKWWNAGISLGQRIWLMEILDQSLAQSEPVVIMCHYPTHKPFGGHTLLNSAEMLGLLDGYPNVILWLNGHHHSGGYAMDGTRHHLNLKGMQNEDEHWYQIDFSADRIKVYQAEDTTTPKYDLDIARPLPTAAAPDNFAADLSDGSALLRWDAPPDGVTAVVIERRHLSTAEAWQKVAVIQQTQVGEHTDSPDKPVQEFAYRIRFEDQTEGSPYSHARTPTKK